MIALLQSGLKLKDVITHRFPLARFEEGFDLMRAGRSGKVVLDWAV